MISWRNESQPCPVFLRREFHGQRSLADYSPWSSKELDMTEQLTHTHTHMQIYGLSSWLHFKESTCQRRRLGSIPELGRSPGEGSGNPLQYSCLGNPMDRGTWWAMVHGVARSQTQLSD